MANNPKIEFIHGWPTEKVQTYRKAWAESLRLPLESQDTFSYRKKGTGLIGILEFQEKNRYGGRTYRDSYSGIYVPEKIVRTKGPEMVLIPPGEYLMGAPEGEGSGSNGMPQRRIALDRPFYMGRYVVTFAEYDGFCEAVGLEKPNYFGDDMPMIDVSWHQAMAYAEWLSRKVGKRFRLPTEAEWEYAARAGTAGPYSFDGQISTSKANYGYDYPKLLPVRCFTPNPWGLYQVHGNVWEWTSSADGDWTRGSGTQCVRKDATAGRILRGGSHRCGEPSHLCSSARNSAGPDGHYGSDFGFRLLQVI